MGMLRRASGHLVPFKQEPGKRIASVEPAFEMKPGHLYFSTRAMHWEQCDRKGVYKGNDNGDFWEGGMNVVWACNNKRCANKDEHKRFLKYAGKENCPHCNGTDIRDWEYEVFGKKGELLTKTDEGKYRWETWKGAQLNRNHNEKDHLGQVVDVWPVPPHKGIDELLEVDAALNKRLAERIALGQVTGTSLEVLVGASMCSCCFHIATDEHAPKEKGGWCDHLRMYKGRYDPKTGQRVFEINKNLIGSGHAIIESGEPADQGARISQVFASADFDANLNKVMATKKHVIASDNNPPPDASVAPKGMPVVSASVQAIIEKNAAKRRSVGNARVGNRSEGTDLPSGPVSVPDFRNMGAQLKAFGNYVSSRSDEEVAMAGLPPEMRKKMEAMNKMDTKTKIALGIEEANPLRVDKEFVAAHLKPLVATKKVTAKAIAAAINELTGTETERAYFSSGINERTLSGARTAALKRLASRKACMEDSESIKELVIDALGDALQDAADSLSQQVTEDTTNDLLLNTEQLIDTDDHQNDFVEYLDEGNDATQENLGEIASGPEVGDVPMEGSEKDAIMVKTIPQVEATEKEENMKIEAQVQPHVTTQRKTPTETEVSATNLDGNGLDKNPKAVEVPASEERSSAPAKFPTDSMLATLTARKASLQEQLLTAKPEEFATIVASLKKVEAQIKIETESFPMATELGGNGLDKNASPVDVKHEAPRSTPTATTPGSDETASSAQDGNGLRTAKVEVEKAPAERSTKSEEFPVAKDQKREDEKARDMKKEIMPGNDDNALEKDKMTKTSDMNKADQDAKNQGVASPSGSDADKTDIDNKGQAAPTKKEDGEADVKMQGQEAKTPTITNEQQDAAQGKTTPSKPANPDADAKVKGQDAPTKSTDEYDDARSLAADPDALSYPKDMLRSGSVTAEFVELTEPGKRSASYWEVKHNDEPLCRITAKAAWEDSVIEKFSVFASADYGRKLVAELQEHGLAHVAKETFKPGALEIVRKAQSVSETMPVTNPTNTAAPVSVSPGVSDKVLNEAKPGLATADILSNTLAPLIIESDSLSTSGVIKDLVELAGDQNKVTEFTTKLNEAVQTLRNKAGMPSDSGAAAPAAAPMENAAAPAAPAQPTAPAPEAYGATQMTAQASRIAELEAANSKLQTKNSALLRGQRIESVVKAAQSVGILDNYNKFVKAGKSRKEAKRMAQKVIETEVTKFLSLPNEACESSLDTLIKSVKAVAALGDRSASRRAASFEQMNREAGNVGILTGLSGDNTSSPEWSKKNSLSLSWKVANSIDSDKFNEQSKHTNRRKDD